MIWFVFGVVIGVIFMKVTRALWCSSCVSGEQLGHTRECQIRHIA